jgi:hypothetical protein
MCWWICCYSATRRPWNHRFSEKIPLKTVGENHHKKGKNNKTHTHTHKNHRPRPHNKKRKSKGECEISFLYVTRKKEMVVDVGISYRRRGWRKTPRRTPAICSVAEEHTHVQSTQTPPAPHVRTREAKHTTFFFSFLSRVISFQLDSRIFAFVAIFACVTTRCAIFPFVSIFFRASWETTTLPQLSWGETLNTLVPSPFWSLHLGPFQTRSQDWKNLGPKFEHFWLVVWH